jgi:hypothetical protein
MTADRGTITSDNNSEGKLFPHFRKCGNSNFTHRELEQQSNGLLSRKVRVQVPGDAPFHLG